MLRRVNPVVSAVPYARRFLNVHEYVAMDLMAKNGVRVPKHALASSPAEAKAAFLAHKGNDMVIKAQALTGGRGRGAFKNGFKGGVHVVTSAHEAEAFAGKMLQQRLVTKQTSAEGLPVAKVLLMERLYLRRETYFSIMMDRTSSGPLLIGSPRGGMNIEEVAAETPDLIFTEKIDVAEGVRPEQAERLAKNMGFEGEALNEAAQTMMNLYKLFIASDATLVEINPLAETPEGHVYAIDAKLNFDDNAEFRQASVFASRDRTQEDAREVEASLYGLNYIQLDGSIGCLVNGAGLAMATMDIIKLNGGAPANFLDVGGGATKQQVEKAFELLNQDKKVKAVRRRLPGADGELTHAPSMEILVNIFGGIMKCDVIASGIVGVR